MSEGLCWGASLTSTFLTSSSLSIQGIVPVDFVLIFRNVILMYHPCSPEAKLDRIERRREHIRTVSIYGEVWDMVEERALQLAPPPGHSSLIVHRCFPTFLDISASYLSILPIYARTHPPTENPTSSLAPPPPTSKTHQQETWTSVWMWRAPPCTFPTLPAPAPAIYFTFSPRLLTVSHLDLVAGEDALDPLMQLQQNLAALNQAITIIN